MVIAVLVEVLLVVWIGCTRGYDGACWWEGGAVVEVVLLAAAVTEVEVQVTDGGVEWQRQQRKRYPDKN